MDKRTIEKFLSQISNGELDLRNQELFRKRMEDFVNEDIGTQNKNRIANYKHQRAIARDQVRQSRNERFNRKLGDEGYEYSGVPVNEAGVAADGERGVRSSLSEEELISQILEMQNPRQPSGELRAGSPSLSDRLSSVVDSAKGVGSDLLSTLSSLASSASGSASSLDSALSSGAANLSDLLYGSDPDGRIAQKTEIQSALSDLQKGSKPGTLSFVGRGNNIASSQPSSGGGTFSRLNAPIFKDDKPYQAPLQLKVDQIKMANPGIDPTTAWFQAASAMEQERQQAEAAFAEANTFMAQAALANTKNEALKQQLGQQAGSGNSAYDRYNEIYYKGLNPQTGAPREMPSAQPMTRHQQIQNAQRSR